MTLLDISMHPVTHLSHIRWRSLRQARHRPQHFPPAKPLLRSLQQLWPQESLGPRMYRAPEAQALGRKRRPRTDSSGRKQSWRSHTLYTTPTPLSKPPSNPGAANTQFCSIPPRPQATLLRGSSNSPVYFARGAARFRSTTTAAAVLVVRLWIGGAGKWEARGGLKYQPPVTSLLTVSVTCGHTCRTILRRKNNRIRANTEVAGEVCPDHEPRGSCAVVQGGGGGGEICTRAGRRYVGVGASILLFAGVERGEFGEYCREWGCSAAATWPVCSLSVSYGEACRGVRTKVASVFRAEECLVAPRVAGGELRVGEGGGRCCCAAQGLR